MAQADEKAPNGAPGVARDTRNRKILIWLLRIVPAALLLGFILLNTHIVEVKFLLWQVQTSMIWALGMTAGLAFVLGYFVARRIRK